MLPSINPVASSQNFITHSDSGGRVMCQCHQRGGLVGGGGGV